MAGGGRLSVRTYSEPGDGRVVSRCRTRVRHRRQDDVPHLRAVLHHEGRRPRDGAGGDPGDRRQPRRRDPGRLPEGKGTTCTVLLPVSDVPATAEPPSVESPSAGAGRVLLADDEEDVRGVVHAMLDTLGYEVIEARDGLEAVEIFRRRSAEIDLVILDLVMPHLTGRPPSADAPDRPGGARDPGQRVRRERANPRDRRRGVRRFPPEAVPASRPREESARAPRRFGLLLAGVTDALPAIISPDPGGLFPPRLFPQVVRRLPDGRRRLLRRGRLARDDDPELVRDAVPFALKAMESLLASSPDHKGLLTALCRGSPSTPSPSFGRTPRRRRIPRCAGRGGARTPALPPGEGVRGARPVGRREGFAAALSGTRSGLGAGRGGGRPAAVLDGRRLEPRRVDVVGRSIAAGRPPRIEALTRRALALDERYDAGAIHEFFVAFEGGRPEAMGGSIERARHHMERAMELSAGRRSPAGHLRRDGVGPDPGPEGVPGPPRPGARLRRAVGGAGVPGREPRVPAPRALAEREGG